MNERLTPTKLHPTDLLRIAVGREKGNVRIDFGSRIQWFTMTPDLALEFATSVVKHATALKGAVT
jgi:hypothetical protein